MNKNADNSAAFGAAAYASNQNARPNAASGNLRRLTLDPERSYATVMKRTADTPIEAIKSAPGNPVTGEFDPLLAEKIAAIEAHERKTKLICPHCGSVSTDVRLSCDNCGNYFDGGAAQSARDVRLAALNASGGLSREELEKLAQKNYLAKRLMAKTIDIAILSALIICEFLVYFAVARSVSGVPHLAYLTLNFFYWGMPIVTLVSILGYQAAFEASQVQATPGKLLLGLYVEDLNKQIVRSEAMVLKTFTGITPAMVLIAVYAYFYHVRLQYGAVLDAPSTAVLALTGLTCFATLAAMHILVGKEDKRRTVLDAISGCRVKERELER
jgi:uncharacterized RDD family membrane protein YckC/ribosomal protein L37AE/L43A